MTIIYVFLFYLDILANNNTNIKSDLILLNN